MPIQVDTPTGAGIRDAIDLRRFPWIRPLVTTYAREFSAVAPLFAGDPADPAVWARTITRVQRAPRDRARITEVVLGQLDRRGAHDVACTAARRLADASSVAIVTGQQAGVFGGPLYTLLKAVTAIQLARRVEAEHNVPAVALFWVDGEDHDFEEIRSATLLDQDFTPATVTLGTLPGAGNQPAARLRLDGQAGPLLSDLERILPPTEFTDDLLARLRRHYREDATMASSFAGWIDDLLSEQGLVVFEAADQAAKPLVADLFEAEVAHPARTSTLVRDAGLQMAKLGHSAQVEPADDAAALFYLNADGRRPLKRRDGGYTIGEAPVTAADLCREAASHPERFSPNVLLRPLVQDRLFPTVCYVAGPSELAYQAQLGAVYQALGVEAPLLYSRASATLLDSASARFLDRYPVAFESLQAQDESVLNKLLDDQLPPSIDATLAEIDAQLSQQCERLKEAVTAVDPTLAGAVDTTMSKARETLKTLHGKIVQASKRKDETLRRQFVRTRTLAFPQGAPQERVLNVAFFMNRYGPTLCRRLLETLPLETDKHFLLVV